jgi:hypothetical protein
MSRIFLFFFSLSMFLSITSFGQPGLPPPGPGTPVPVSGIEILAAAGALLGCGRLIKKNFFRKAD